MKKGKWNYTEDITYRVIKVKLLAVPDAPMSWQNAFMEERRQVVEITSAKGHVFLIDNQDGSGLLKISKGGGPDSYSAHVAGYEFISEVPEADWQSYDRSLHDHYRNLCDEWQKENHPDEYQEMKSLIKSFKKTVIVIITLLSSIKAHSQTKSLSATSSSSITTADTTQAYFLVSSIPDKKGFSTYAIAGYEVWDRLEKNKLVARLTKDRKLLPNAIIIWQTIR